MKRYDRPHTFIYLDPPYWQTEGCGVPFDSGEYEAMAALMRKARGKVTVSINDHPDIRRAFDGFHMLELDIRYSVANRHGRPDTSGELVITNWEPGVMGGLF